MSDVTLENDDVLKKSLEYIVGLPETGNISQSAVKTAPKTKSVSHPSETSSSRNFKTINQRQREVLIAKHRRE